MSEYIAFLAVLVLAVAYVLNPSIPMQSTPAQQWFLLQAGSLSYLACFCCSLI